MTLVAIMQKDIESKIFTIRGLQVMLDRDLAELYGVTTKVLNQAVKRNAQRFPPDFMFRLSKTEKDELVTICDQFKPLRHSTVPPHAFTEQGVAMLSSILNSERAIHVNIVIMRTFVAMREIGLTHKDLTYKLNALEAKLKQHDADISCIFEAIRKLITTPDKPKRKIGFHRD